MPYLFGFYATGKSQPATSLSHAATLFGDKVARASELHDKIAGVTSHLQAQPEPPTRCVETGRLTAGEQANYSSYLHAASAMPPPCQTGNKTKQSQRVKQCKMDNKQTNAQTAAGGELDCAIPTLHLRY